MKPGPKSILDDRFKLKIREWIISGKTDEELAQLSGVSIATINSWKFNNYKGFRKDYDTWRHERMLAKAEGNIEEYLSLDTKNLMKKGEKLIEATDTGLEKIKADMSKFVAETLGRDSYARKNESAPNINNLLAIENAVINIANGERKPLHTGRVEPDEATGGDPVQRREREAIDIDEYTISDVQSDIQALLSQSKPNGTHEVREESSGGSSDIDESGDVSGEVGNSSRESSES